MEKQCKRKNKSYIPHISWDAKSTYEPINTTAANTITSTEIIPQRIASGQSCELMNFLTATINNKEIKKNIPASQYIIEGETSPIISSPPPSYSDHLSTLYRIKTNTECKQVSKGGTWNCRSCIPKQNKLPSHTDLSKEGDIVNERETLKMHLPKRL